MSIYPNILDYRKYRFGVNIVYSCLQKINVFLYPYTTVPIISEELAFVIEILKNQKIFVGWHWVTLRLLCGSLIESEHLGWHWVVCDFLYIKLKYYRLHSS